MNGDAMLIWGLALLGIAAILLVVEVFVPSAGVIASISGISALAGVIILWMHDTAWGLAGLLVTLVLGPTMLYWAFKMMPHTPMGRAILGGRPDEELDAREMSEHERLMSRKALVGLHGIALTDLRPIGDVEIEGQHIEALAEMGWIEAGSPVVVTHADGLEIKVRAADA